MKTPQIRFSKCKISLWTEVDEGNWSKAYDVQARYLEGQNFIKVMNPLNFGSSIINPYHVFQIRKLPNLSSQMRILKDDDDAWFKIKNIAHDLKANRFLNIVVIPLPQFPVNKLDQK